MPAQRPPIWWVDWPKSSNITLFGNGFYRWMRNRRGWGSFWPSPPTLSGVSRQRTSKLIYYVPADEILTHRVIWSFFFMVALISVSRQWPQVKKLLKTPRKIFLLALSAVLVGGNWLLFIWAVNNHHMLEASLGYFINPLVNILLGMIFLGERFRRLQWLAVILAFLRRAGPAVDLWFAADNRSWAGFQFCPLRPGAKENCCRCANRHAGGNAVAATGGGNLVVRHHRQPDQPYGREPLVAQSAADGRGRGDHHPFAVLYRGRQRVCGSPRWAFSSTSAQR